MRLPLLFLLVFSILQADVKTYAYRCDDGFGFVVRFERGQTWLFGPGFGEPLLFIRPGGRGDTLYTNGDTVLDVQKERATLTRKGRVHAGCRNDPRRAIWEDAKLRGVDFRAVGNEPPWILEITGDRLDLYEGYDRRHERFRATPKSDAKKRETVYEAKEGAFRVVLRPGPCRDTMADEVYETRVEIFRKGRRLRGCGMALH